MSEDLSYICTVIRKIINIVLIILGVYFGIKLAIFYMPFLIGFVISLFVEPLIKLVVKKTKLERKKGAIIILAIIFIILLGLLTWGVVTLLTESSNLLQSLNKYIQLIYSKINEYINNCSDYTDDISAYLRDI